MGLIHSPSIVSDGLVLALDAQNSRSYGGSGTTWTDVSYNGNNGTLTNGPTFEPGGPFAGSTGGSVYFDGSGDYVDIASSSDFIFDGDFTIEYWIYREGGNVWFDIGKSNDYTNSIQFYSSSGNFHFYMNSSTATNVGGAGYMNVPTNQWVHHAVSRSGTTCRVFADGVLKKTTTLSGTAGNNASNILRLGAQIYNGPSEYFQGYLSNLRIVKGTALYTSNFTPPTKPLTPVSGTSLLTCQGGVIVDNSSNKFSITKNGDARAIQSASIKFDGGDDYAPIANNSLPTGDYTINCWVKTPSVIPVTQYDVIISTSQYFWYFGIYLDKFTIDNNDGTFRFGSTLSASTWYNVTVTRSGSTDTAYINGVSQGTNTNSAALSGNWEIGRWANSPSHYWNSNIASVSIYNKALSTQEVQQNFNALRGRFGV